MKFLFKTGESPIFSEQLVYSSGGSNSELRLRLLQEQCNFCAYTEKYIEHGIDSTDIEHFDPSKKGNDNYFNYYATLRSANERKIKKYEEYKDSVFFVDLFFQRKDQSINRIKYEDYIYYAVDDDDKDAKGLIDYLGFNDDYLIGVRIKHVKRLKETLGGFSPAELLTYFKRYRSDLSYVTAIEEAFGIDLSEIINDV